MRRVAGRMHFLDEIQLFSSRDPTRLRGSIAAFCRRLWPKRYINAIAPR
jgi:hypothetical protein